MGFGFKSFKKLFSRRGVQTFLLSGGLAPGTMTDKGNEIYEEVHKGLGNLVTGGYIAQKEATEQAKKAAEDAEARYAAEQAAAAETARKIAETEEERKRRLALQGTQMPSTLSGTYLGYPRGTASKSLLG